MVTKHELSAQAKKIALENGADLIGIVNVADLPEHAEDILRILPEAKRVIVVAARHSLAAIPYNECAKAAHQTSRFLESIDFPSVAVPAFIPIDMQAPKKGMRGEICWRRAGVRAGLGSYGENGLLVTKAFGSAIRIAGLVTAADLKADPPLGEDVCDHCMRCTDACPVQALSGEGKIDKKRCGDKIFKYGFRFFAGFMRDLIAKPKSEMEDILRGHGLRELWQTFMTGNYYYCFECQAQCPATNLPQQNQ
jgi:epoxyqueuosine reductase QueG